MNYTNIAITGASSGIGAKLARNFAKEGVCLYLCARSLDKLEALKIKLEAKGAKVFIQSLDISDETKAKEWVDEICKKPIDLLILNAGISSGKDEGAKIELEVARINALGLAYPLFYVLEYLKKQPLQGKFRAHVVLISSIASLLALPNAPAYSASKHFVSALGEALALAYEELCFSTICPGFIKTPLTAHLKLKMMELDTACEKITWAIKKQKRFYAFPFSTALLARIYNLLPFCIKRIFVAFLMRRARL